MTHLTAADRVRSFGYVIIAGIYFYIAQSISVHAANGLSSGLWLPLIQRSILLFLLVVGYAAMARAFNRQREPIRGMGLVFRPGWRREFGLGAALGWGMLVASILPLVLSGGLIITFWLIPRQFGILLIDLLLLAVAALAEEVAFRGYPFQRLIEAMGLPWRPLFFPSCSPHCTCSIPEPIAPAFWSPFSAVGCCRLRICAPARFGSAGAGTLPGMPACACSLDCR